MSIRSLLPALAASLLWAAFPAQAQQAPQNFPDGPGKETVLAVCGGCHEVNRVRAGYTADGWRTVVRMMQNVGAPVPADQWETVTAYLIKSFPEKARPAATEIKGPVEAVIKEWP